MGYTLTEWVLFYSTFSLTAWAVHAAAGRSRWTVNEWLAHFQQQGGTAYDWACWACSVQP